MSSLGNADIEKDLNELPDLVSDTLQIWRIATLDREKTEALLYVKIRGEDDKRTATEIKALIQSDEKRYQMVLEEIKAECEYTRLYEKLMSTKRISGLRTAF